MNDERKPELERLFAAADRKLADETFVAGVMARTRTWSVRRLAIGFAVCVVAAPVAWLLAAPVNDALQSVMQLIAEPIVSDAGNGLASRIALPINSVGAALVIVLLGLRAIGRRLLSSRS